MPRSRVNSPEFSALAADIGARLRALRLAAGLTQRGADRLLRGQRGLVGGWETGTSSPGALYLIRLARLYGVTADYILGLAPSRARGDATHGPP